MGKYQGYRCAHCNEIFSEADDVVVCPVCGAPHHRDCYLSSGRCAAEELHQRGENYRPLEEEKKEENKKPCPRCGKPLHPEAVFCPHCKTDLSNIPKQPFSVFPIHPDDEIEGVKAKDLAEYVGPSSPVFLHKWKIAEKAGSFFSLNFSALFFGPFYYLYRKMNLLGIIFLIFRFVSNIPYMIYTIGELTNSTANFSDWTMLANIFSIVSLIVNILAALFFNKLYLNKAVSDIKNPNKKKKGGISMAAVLISLAALFVATYLFTYIMLI
jgi:hypothetical protein